MKQGQQVHQDTPATGFIYNIQRFCIHDGPGIRTTVFFKGCPLRCAWCANPESRELKPQLMIRPTRCMRCGRCVDICPNHALYYDQDGTVRIRWSLCDQCHACVGACTSGALEVIGEAMGVPRIIHEVEKDRLFYRNSGGGVTISGGEPLFQPDFLLELLAALRLQGMHTALDTCGYCEADLLSLVLPEVDLFLFDVKHLDACKHREFTGADNRCILENLRYVAAGARTWVRVPVIPGFNDSPEDIGAIADFAREIGAEKVSLLPYHEGGLAKHAQIGSAACSLHIDVPEESAMSSLCAAVETRGITVTLRG